MTKPLSALQPRDRSLMPQDGAKVGTLHLLCGKIAAGKSTLAAELARKPGTVLIAEDEWLSTLFGDQMCSVAEYVRVSDKLRSVMGAHVAMVLGAADLGLFGYGMALFLLERSLAMLSAILRNIGIKGCKVVSP